MTAGSIPAWTSAMAALWRRVCGVTVLLSRLGQPGAAFWTYLASRWATASRDSGFPARVGNRGSSGLPPRSPSQEASVVTVGGVSGVHRDRRFLPAAGHVRAGAQVDIGDGQAGQFGDAQPGLGGQRQQGL